VAKWTPTGDNFGSEPSCNLHQAGGEERVHNSAKIVGTEEKGEIQGKENSRVFVSTTLKESPQIKEEEK